MKRWIKEHPWIWIVFFFIFMLGADAAIILISIYQRPILVN